MEIHSCRDDADGRQKRSKQPQVMPVASAAHELCNHLQVISSALRLLERSVHNETPLALEIIFRGARASLDSANRVSRGLVDAGACGPVVQCRTSLAERLSTLRETLVIAAGTSILVEYDVREDVPDVMCATEALDDAILNVVANAGRAMPAGGRLTITAACDHAARDGLPCAVLQIADTGCGMPAETAARAFEPRFTTRSQGEGSGVGLAMVAAFARAAGGSAELESQPGAGTIVTIRLPGLLKSAKVAADPTVAPQHQASSHAPDRRT